jgi:hypothetical protein
VGPALAVDTDGEEILILTDEELLEQIPLEMVQVKM